MGREASFFAHSHWHVSLGSAHHVLVQRGMAARRMRIRTLLHPRPPTPLVLSYCLRQS